MSRKQSRKQRTRIQTLEQLLLMSASGSDVDVLDLEGLPVSDEVAEQTEAVESLPAEDAELEDAVRTQEFDDEPVGEPTEFLPEDGPFPEFLFEAAEVDPAAASGPAVVEGPLEAPTEVPPELIVIEGPDGDLIEVPPDELPNFLFELSEVDPAASSGPSIGESPLEAPTEVPPGAPPELIVIEGPDGDLIEVSPDELPDFLFEPTEVDPAASSGVVDADLEDRPPEIPVDPPLEEQVLLSEGVPPEFLTDGQEFNEIFATGVTDAGEPDDVSDVELLEFLPMGEPVAVEDLSDSPFLVQPIALEFATGEVTEADSESEIPLSSDDLATVTNTGSQLEFPDVAFVLDQSLGDIAAAGGAVGENSEGDEASVMGDESGFDTTGAVNDSQSQLQDIVDSVEDNVIFQSVAGGGNSAAAASILGSGLAEWISGTIGDDVIDAGAGNDEIHAASGVNIVDGGDGEDTLVVYEGIQADYVIARLASGVTTLEGPGLNGETVRVELSNVEMILFNDGVLQLDSLSAAGGIVASTSTVTGTSLGEWIVGTSQDDSIFGDDGDDEIYAPIGMNTIDGGNGFDTLVVYEGNRADFVLSRLSSGAVVLEGIGLNGQTVRSEMTNVERILFNDGAVLASAV